MQYFFYFQALVKFKKYCIRLALISTLERYSRWLAKAVLVNPLRHTPYYNYFPPQPLDIPLKAVFCLKEKKSSEQRKASSMDYVEITWV